ncbi:hypothetical protein NDU88_006921 [Pleurodeles waltl]|uniref:Uncharacterized protein n=1 Tax=Pleurodeles waltl TaxID=8319 RepID=A0AAV7M1G9_PLEWA|nr:hypothetical protein NDU88_006921 [Pleurodeles waltl]
MEREGRPSEGSAVRRRAPQVRGRSKALSSMGNAPPRHQCRAARYVTPAADCAAFRGNKPHCNQPYIYLVRQDRAARRLFIL